MCPDLCLSFPIPGFVWSLFALDYAFHMYVLEGLCVQYYVPGSLWSVFMCLDFLAQYLLVLGLCNGACPFLPTPA